VRPEEATYGSDKHGLVWGYLFAPGQPPAHVDSDAAAEWLAASPRSPQNSFLWLHFALSNAASERWLRSHLTLPDTFYEFLGSNSIGSTRLEQDGDALVAVVHDAVFDFTFDPAAVSTVCLCIEPRLFLSARLRPLRSIDRLRGAVKAGQGFRSSAELLAHLLREQAGVLVDIARESSSRVDLIEDKLLEDRIPLGRRELAALRRTLVRLQRLLAPEPAALFRLLSRPPGWIAGDNFEDLRQAAEEFSTAVSDTAALVERIKILQEELAATINEQTNRTLFTLTIVTVLALPINLVASLLGMNVGGIPFGENSHGFFLIVAALVGLTAVLAYLTLGRRRD
jgi:zinc transporter